MLGTHVDQLQGTDPGVENALDLVAGFDDALTNGFVRITEERAAALTAFASALGVTPLGERVGEAVEKVLAGSIADEHLMALAGARIALFGAVHDALLARFDAALGRQRAAWDAVPAPGEEFPNLLAGSRSWLRELAIAGWRGVDHDLVSGAAQTLQSVLEQPGLRRLAVLLDGLAAELRAASPVATMDRLPVRRWADLWSRALLLSQPGGASPAAEPVSGRLLILGADVHEHATAIQVQVHGILEGGSETPRMVRASVSAAKVDTIVGPAVWRMLEQHAVLLNALAKHTAVALTDMPMLPSGDLVWDDARARPDSPADPFATARLILPTALAPAVPPTQRHPAAIAEPVLLEGYQTATNGGLTFTWGGSSDGLAVATGRLPSCGALTPHLVAGSSACIGLLRWDAGRWLVQPLAIQTTNKRATVTEHTGSWAAGLTDPKAAKAEAKIGDVVGVLRERAGRLLRK